MKTKIYIILIGLIVSEFAVKASSPILTVPGPSKHAVIDGIVDSNDPWFKTWINSNTGCTAATTRFDNEFKSQIVYDDTNLYIVFDFYIYNMADTTSSDTSKKDYTEVYLALDTNTWAEKGVYHAGDWHFKKFMGTNFPIGLVADHGDQSLPDAGQLTDLLANPEFKIGEKNYGDEYIQEWSLPWSTLAIGMDSSWNRSYFKFDIETAKKYPKIDSTVTYKIFGFFCIDEKLHNTNNLALLKLATPVDIKREYISFNDISKVYPNPSGEYIYISNLRNEVSQVMIFNTHGQLLIDNFIQQNQNVNIKALRPGFYIVKVINASEVININFVKN